MKKINEWALAALIVLAVCMIIKYNMEKPVSTEHFDNAMAETNMKIDSLKAMVMQTNDKIDSVSCKIDSIMQLQHDLKNGQRSIMDKLENKNQYTFW